MPWLFVGWQKFTSDLLSDFKALLSPEYHFIFFVFCCALGILYGYQNVAFECLYWQLLIPSCLLLLYLTKIRIPWPPLQVICSALTFFVFGAALSLGKNIYYHSIKPLEVRGERVSGTIESVSYGSRMSIVIGELMVDGFISLPNKIKVFGGSKFINRQISQIYPSAKIELLIKMSPHRSQELDVLSGIQNYAKLIQIVSIQHSACLNLLYRLRSAIASRILLYNDGSSGFGVVMALAVGNTGYIKNKDLNNIRDSGFSHLLAISGLHIGVIVGSMFFLFRWALSHHGYLSLYWDIKKISAAFACIVAFIYLQITNMSISAIRSFIMFILVLIGILCDKKTNPIRLWSISLFIALVFASEKIFTASMQMSFMATLALIALYRGLAQRMKNIGEINLYFKFISYIGLVSSSSLLANFATSIYEVYHFGQWSLIGLISNQVAVPIAELALLPLCIVAILLMPLNLEGYLFKLCIALGNFLCWIGEYFASFKNGILVFFPVSGKILLLQTICMLLLFLGRRRVSQIGFLLSISLIVYNYKPDGVWDIIIDTKNEAMFYRTSEDRYCYYGNRSDAINRSKWPNRLKMNPAFICANDRMLNEINYNVLLYNFYPHPTMILRGDRGEYCLSLNQGSHCLFGSNKVHHIDLDWPLRVKSVRS